MKISLLVLFANILRVLRVSLTFHYSQNNILRVCWSVRFVCLLVCLFVAIAISKSYEQTSITSTCYYRVGHPASNPPSYLDEGQRSRSQRSNMCYFQIFGWRATSHRVLKLSNFFLQGSIAQRVLVCKFSFG